LLRQISIGRRPCRARARSASPDRATRSSTSWRSTSSGAPSPAVNPPARYGRISARPSLLPERRDCGLSAPRRVPAAICTDRGYRCRLSFAVQAGTDQSQFPTAAFVGQGVQMRPIGSCVVKRPRNEVGAIGGLYPRQHIMLALRFTQRLAPLRNVGDGLAAHIEETSPVSKP
jgi:hypothetical protein